MDVVVLCGESAEAVALDLGLGPGEGAGTLLTAVGSQDGQVLGHVVARLHRGLHVLDLVGDANVAGRLLDAVCPTAARGLVWVTSDDPAQVALLETLGWTQTSAEGRRVTLVRPPVARSRPARSGRRPAGPAGGRG